MRIAIRKCKVDCDRELDLAAAKNVVQKRMSLTQLKLDKTKDSVVRSLSFAVQYLELGLGRTRLNLGQCQIARAQVLVLAALLGLEELNLEF